MKFEYEYRTSDNVRHRGVVAAFNRDAAFRELKSQGIRPALLVEAPGFFNKLLGKGKRWMAITLLGALSIYLLVLSLSQKEALKVSGEILPSPRHQIYGDPALLESWIRSDYATVFDKDGDRLLARFARPALDVEPIDHDALQLAAEQLMEVVSTGVAENSGDVREVKELKSIVLWMKGELAEYLNAGETADSYVVQLMARQRKEKQIFENVRMQLDGVLDDLVWDEKNAALRSMGLPTIPQPE